VSIYKNRFAIVRNKKFKYYKDKTMKQIGGIIDFDRIQCVIIIDDGFQREMSPEEDEF